MSDGRRLIPAAIMVIFVFGMMTPTLGTLLPELSKRFNLTPEQNGNIALTQAIGMIIASISAGPLIDNRGKKTGLLLGMGLATASLFLLPSASGGKLTALFFVFGLGSGIIVTASNALISDISEERRASTMNFLNVFFGLGGLSVPFVGSYLSGNTIALCYLVAVLTTITMVVNAAAPIPPPTGTRGFSFREVGLLLSRPQLYLFSLLLFLYVGCEIAIWTWLTRYLMGQGISQPAALSILSLGFALGMLVGRAAVSPILTKVPSSAVVLVASILMAFTTYAMLQASTAYAAGIIVFLAGVAMAPVFPTSIAMVGDAFPKMTATAMGIVITCGWIGSAVSSRVIGAIASDDPARLKTALLLLPAASIAMILVNIAIRFVPQRIRNA